MKSDFPDRSSLPSVLGMPCAIISLISGLVSLIVASMLWWGTFAPTIKHVGEQAGLVSAVLGLGLAGIGLASQRKLVRRVAVVAVLVNLTILSLTIDTIFMLIR